MSLPTQASPVFDRDPGLDFFEEFGQRFDVAVAAAGGPVEREFELAGLALRLSGAGNAMLDSLMPPLAGLDAALAEGPELTIRLFDTASTGVEAPALPWRPGSPEEGTKPLARYESSSCAVLAEAEGGALTAAVPSRGEAIFHLADAERLPLSERGAALREALHLLMAPRERWMTHAGAVGREGRGVLLVGSGGSGKSTLALSCALAGMEVVADDYVLLEPGAPPVAHALLSIAKLTADSADRLGVAASAARSGFTPTLEGDPKAAVYIDAIAPGSLRSRLDVGAVIAPLLCDANAPSLTALPPARALQAVAPSAVLQMRTRNSPLMGVLGKLVREAPAYSLSLCPDAAANAAAVREVVDGLG